MVKLLQMVTPLAAAVTTPIAPSTTPATTQTQTTSQTTTQATVNWDYSPDRVMSFTNFKDVLETVIKNLPPNDSNATLAAIIFGLSHFTDKFSQNELVIDKIVTTAPFTPVSEIFKNIATKEIVDEFINKFLPTIRNQTTDNLQLSVLAANQLDVIHKNIVDQFNAFVPQKDNYLDGMQAPEIATFIQQLKSANIPLKETDPSTLTIAAAKKVLDTDLNDSVDEFQKAINAKFASADAFRDAVVKKIASDFIDNDKISEEINKEVDDIYNKNDDNIKKFGLAILTSKFEEVKSEYEDILDGKVSGTPGTKEISDKLKTDLENAKTFTDITQCIDSFKTARDNLTKLTEDKITNKAKDLITQVKNEWATVINALPSQISYWNAIQARNNLKSGKLQAFRSLFNDQSALNQFLAAWSDSDTSNQKIANFDFEFELKYDGQLQPGQRTVVNSKIVLSSEVKKSEDAGNKFVDGYATDITIWEHSISQQPVTVSIKDLAEIIKDDFKNNSKPTDPTKDLWAINPDVSSLDLDKFWNAIDQSTNQSITQSDFTPPIMTFKTLDDIKKLFPRIKWIIDDSSVIVDSSGTATHTQYGFSDTLKDTLFAGTNPAKITITTKPVDQKVSEKTTSYAIELIVSDANNLNNEQVDIQANNVPVYDEELDAVFENALKTLLIKTPAEDGEGDDAKSFAGVIMGHIWNHPNVVKDSDGNFDFQNLFELLNLFFFTGGAKGQEVQNIVTDEMEAELLKTNTTVNAAKTALDKLSPTDPGRPAQEKAYKELLIAESKEDLIENTVTQLMTIAGLDYQKVLGKANPLQQIDSMEDIVKNLKVSGKIKWELVSGKYEITVEFNSASKRWKSDFTGSRDFKVAVHELSSEINESVHDIDEADKDYIPLLEQLEVINDLPSDKYVDLQKQINDLKGEFNKSVHQEETPEGITKLTELYKNLIRDAINKSLNLQPSDEISTLPPATPNYITGIDTSGQKLYNNSLIKVAKNASTQFNAAYDEFRKALEQVAPTLIPNILNNPDPTMTQKSLVSSIERFIELKGREQFGSFMGHILSDNEKDEINSLVDKFKQAGINDDINALINPIIKVETIANVVYNVAEESATINASGKNDEIKRLATYKIADYLAHADLSDLQKLKNIKDFLKNPLGASQVKLTVPMKATVLALGGFMALVGLGASFSTIRSIFTNRNLRTIGEDASIEYEKPKKTMAIKTVISVAALMSAATIISLVLTLWGGL